jgi:uncharacterized membrane protein
VTRVTTLSIWGFDASGAAERALRSLERLQTRRVLEVDDVAVVDWPADSSRPQCYQVGTTAGTSELTGAFWGLLFGLLFLLPLAGQEALTSVGLTEEFLARTRERVVAGTSAVFVLSAGEVLETIRAAIADSEPLVSALSPEQERELLRAFAADRI